MKSKFLAGLIATLIALVFVVGISIFLVAVLDVDASKNWFTYSAAFATIAVWTGVYKWLKPKDPEDNQNNDEYTPPAREINI